MEVRENQRVALTKRLLKEGLLRLLREKELDKINVSELCRESGINRATFYKHYGAPQDVLRDIEQDVVRRLRQMAPAVRTRENAKQYLEDICAYLYDHADLMKILLSCNTEEDLVAMFSEMNRLYWGKYESAMQEPRLDDDSVKLMITFFSSGIYYLIRQWLLEDVPKSPREVADLAFRFVSSA